jgi:hypothetical protein
MKRQFNSGARPVKRFTLPLVLVLVFSSLASAQATLTDEPSQSATAKAAVQKRGIGEKSKVKVKLRSNVEVKGYISKIEDASFDLTDKSSGQVTTIPYADVQRVQGVGLSKGAKIGIITGVGVAIVAIVFAAEFKAHGY